MKITQQQLKDWSACTDGYKWACGILKDKPMEVKKFLKITADHRLDWANWVIVRVMTYDQYVSYAVYAAEQVIDIYEKKYPDDKRPREAIEAAKKCIGLKGAALAAARAAGDAARDAAWAAGDAARDAARAAGDAARAAALAAARAAGDAARDAAWAAGDAARAAAGAAAWAAGDAAKEQMQIKILEYGLSLIE
jgi:hypothetical protein